jgi:hypothetical protein
MTDESFSASPFALSVLRQGNGWRAGDQDEQNRQKADSVSKLSKVKAPITAVLRDAIATTFLLSGRLPQRRDHRKFIGNRYDLVDNDLRRAAHNSLCRIGDHPTDTRKSI